MALKDQQDSLRDKFNRLVGREKGFPTDDDGEGGLYRADKLARRSKFGTVGVASVPAEKGPVIRVRKPLGVNALAFKI